MFFGKNPLSRINAVGGHHEAHEIHKKNTMRTKKRREHQITEQGGWSTPYLFPKLLVSCISWLIPPNFYSSTWR